MSIAHDNVKARYQRINRINEKKLDDRKQAIYKKSPKIKKLNEEISNLNLELLKAAILSDNSDKLRIDISSKRDRLHSQIYDELKKLKLEKDYLDPIYDCVKCKDTGYINSNTRCHCYNKYILEERIKDSSLSKSSGIFENFNPSVFDNKKIDSKMSQAAYMQDLKKRAEKYAEDFPNGKFLNFVLMGKPGTGKTFLAEAILNRILKKGFVGEYYTASRLFTLFYKHRMGENIDLDILVDLPILVIDDLGTEIMTKNVTVEYFYNLINERSVRGYHTVIATNMNSENIAERYGDRTFSRICSKNSEVYLIPSRFDDIRI